MTFLTNKPGERNGGKRLEISQLPVSVPGCALTIRTRSLGKENASLARLSSRALSELLEIKTDQLIRHNRSDCVLLSATLKNLLSS